MIQKKFNSKLVKKSMLHSTSIVCSKIIKQSEKITMSSVPSKSFLVKSRYNFNKDNISFNDQKVPEKRINKINKLIKVK